MLLIVALIVIPALVTTVRALNRQEHRSDPTAAATNAVLIGALDEETGIRGYVITADASFLDPVSTGSDQVADALATLHGSDVEPGIGPAVDAMESALQTWRTTFADVVVTDIRAGNVAAAQSILESGRGKDLFDAFRARHDALQTQVAHDVSSSRRGLRHDVELSLLGLALALAVGFAIAFSLWLWWRVWGRRETERDQELADLGILLQSVLEATTEPIFAKDADGRHILANRARAASLNRGDADTTVIGRTVDDFVDAEMARTIRDEDRRVIETGEASRCEEILRQPDGPHIFLTTKNALASADGRRIGIVGVARDVTLERLLEADRERLYQIEHRLAETLQHAMLGNAELDDDRVEVCARYQPAIEDLTVGGDWYDVVALPNEMIGLIVGDAVGRGIDAATAMGQLRSTLTRARAGRARSRGRARGRRGVRAHDPGRALGDVPLRDRRSGERAARVLGRGSHAAARHHARRPDRLPRRPAGSAARRGRASIGHDGSGARPSRPGRRSCCSPTASWNGAASRSTPASSASRPPPRPRSDSRSARCATGSSTRS